MVPFVWKPAHSFAAIAVCTMGGVLGTLAAWLQSPIYRYCQSFSALRLPGCTRAAFGGIPKLALYWHWPLFGIAVFGIAFYIVMRLRAATSR
jgi:hypothetical protein